MTTAAMPSASPAANKLSTHPSPSSQLVQIGEQTYDLNHHTPMMVQFLQTKAKYPNALLLYRMGDFYELFFEDAKKAAQILDITLTRRGKDRAGQEIPMAGVPFHAADSYMARLIAAGQTVVICEQIDEPSSTSNHLESNSSNTNANNNTNASTSKHTQTRTQNTQGNSKKSSIMRREVVRTLTAGTITDDALISASHTASHTPNVIAIEFMHQTKQQNSNTSVFQVGISRLDLSAGQIICQQISTNNQAQLYAELETALIRYEPSECIINEALALPPRIDHPEHLSTLQSSQAHFVQWLEQTLTCPLIYVSATDFCSKHASSTLCEQFAVRHLDGLGIGNSPVLQVTTAALIHYAKQTQQRSVPHVNQLIVENNQDYLILDEVCQRNLELFASVSVGGTALIDVLNHCRTPMGKRLLPQHLKRPLRNRLHITLRLDALTHLLTQDEQALQNLSTALADIADIERISGRIGLNTAKPRDLKRLASSIRACQQLHASMLALGVNPNANGLLAMLLSQLPAIKLPNDNQHTYDTQPNLPELNVCQQTELVDVLNLLERAIVDEPPAHIRDGGMIRSGYDEQLDHLQNLHNNVQDTLDSMAQTLAQQYQLPSLKVGFNKVSGFYFELPKGQAKTAPDVFIRRQTLKNSERYITDELKTLENDYLNAQSQALAREKALYASLLIQVAQSIAPLQQLSQAVAQIDVINNWVQLSQQYHWQCPTLTNAVGELAIQQGRHLVVEARLKKQNTTGTANSLQSQDFVANDCVMGVGDNNDRSKNNDSSNNKASERMLLITGPNMGGKSTYMRQVALIVLLASCGSFVPATTAMIGDIDRIFTRIGSADDLAGGKSTFMVEMIETANILNLATQKSLVLMDEVGRGTSTTDGLAMAYACVKRLADMQCLTLFATHYFELTDLANQDERIRNVHVAASEVEGKLLLLHKLRDGAASSSFGLHVAKMAGVPADVLTQAEQYLKDTLANTSLTNTNLTNTNIDTSTHAHIDTTDIDASDNDLDKQQQLPLQPLPLQSLPLQSKPSESSQQSQQLNLQDDPNPLLAKLMPILPMLNELSDINPDEITPKQAHDYLYRIKEWL